MLAGKTTGRSWEQCAAMAGCLLISALFYFNTSRSAAQQATSLKPVTVAHWGSEKILIYLPLYIAIDGDFFRRKGLDVRIQYSGNDDQVFATVAAGAAQFGVGDPSFTAISREKGGNGRLIASLVASLTNWGVTKKLDIPNITDPKQLDGMKITSFPSPSTTFTVLSTLKAQNHLTHMKIVPVLFGSELAALERGAADIAILLEPQTSLAESQGYRVIWSVAKFYGPFLLTGVSTTDAFITGNRAVVQSFVDGLQRAIQFIRSNPDGTVDLIAKSFPSLSKDVLSAAVKRLIADDAVPQSAQVDINAWRKTLELRVAAGDLKSLDAGLQAADNSFADAAVGGRVAPITDEKTETNKKTEPVESSPLAGKGSDGVVRTVWDWTVWTLDRVGAIASILSLLILIWAWWTWKTSMALFDAMSPKQRKVTRQAYVILEGAPDKHMSRFNVERLIYENNDDLTMTEVKEALATLVERRFLRLDGDDYVMMPTIIMQVPRLRLLLGPA